MFNKNKTTLFQYPKGNTRTSYSIPNSVTSIGYNAFYKCTSLTSITIPNSVKSIGSSVFNNCTSLISITIPNSVTSIGDWAFYGCKSLTSVVIGNSVTSIGGDAFYLCESLTSINVNSNNKNYSSQDGVLFNKDKTTIIQYSIGNTRTIYSIPSSVTSIYYNAFSYCTNLTSILIPNSVKSIDSSAFYECLSLKDVYYFGTEAQWNKISIDYGNNCLTLATIHYVKTTVTKQPTCTATGTKVTKCTTCGKVAKTQILAKKNNTQSLQSQQ